MKSIRLILPLLVVALLSTVAIAVFAQTSKSSWPFYAEVTRIEGPGTYDLVVPIQVMDKARPDLADLRIFDSGGREIPYALRIRKDVDDKTETAVNIFNEARIGSASEISVDLGEYVGEHNEVEIETTGLNFRRRVDVEGSETREQWRTLKSGDVIFGFSSQGRAVESNRISYPTSRYRYLRVRVFADEWTDKAPPVINRVRVMMTVRDMGELATWNVDVPMYQLLRNEGAPASAWTIDLWGRVPCDRLTLNVADESFSRPYQVEVADDPQNKRLIASGELSRRIGEESRPIVIKFDQEQHARKLRLVVTDHSNQTLSISSIQAGAPARQLVFELKEGATQPLRLFFGNQNATAPHYDFENEITAKLLATTRRGQIGSFVGNPDYSPEPLPLTERIPWLIYVVLTASSIALALILISLARTVVRMQPAQPEGSGESAGGT